MEWYFIVPTGNPVNNFWLDKTPSYVKDVLFNILLGSRTCKGKEQSFIVDNLQSYTL